MGSRLRGIRADTSASAPDERDGSAVLDAAEQEGVADQAINLHPRFGLNVTGGCCGTDHRHMKTIAKHLAARYGRAETR